MRTLLWRHPRWILSAKTAVAAALAWLLVQPLGGFIHQYPYYAPLGAVVGMSTTVVSSLRASWQAAAAVSLGCLLAVGVQPLGFPILVDIALVVGVGTLLAASPPLGAMGGWVPTAALFALVLGHEHPVGYVAAYGGLLALGALVSVAVNAVFPQLPITPAAVAADQLREEVAGQLVELAEGLREGDIPAARALRHQTRRVDELISAVHEGQRANWRSRRWAETADRQFRLADAVIRLSDCVQEVAELVNVGTIDDRLRDDLAAAMVAVAELLRDGEDAEARAESAVRRLRAAVATDHLAAAAVTANLQRAVDAWR
ncbi:hypothetical protein [Nocardioides aquiterrae]|uniref:FUSC family protein n=1 Tax=Nocardioides aquiterrae TaxID=203799 RepID=A0ABN1UJ83_9ACTN